MANAYFHSVSSAKKWGGTPEEYLAYHEWFDQSKMLTADFRHRALRHHAEGIFMLATIFGPTLTLISFSAGGRSLTLAHLASASCIESSVTVGVS